ncbi:hypothetical protein IV68_GL000206 [Weissella halotolerans DSM 20190]|uniref:Uncharacterized protein n=1 Tax=Weissella halotolerans DSM 20190 TaxID=1123500 RepID=A0A0R2FYY5_9LACO|nr:hypothetical protein IV68_GL000206 [Weissella halotolerans DSM 20190]
MVTLFVLLLILGVLLMALATLMRKSVGNENLYPMFVAIIGVLIVVLAIMM